MEPLASMTEGRTNSDLLAACRTGDRDAMRDLYVQNQRRVFSVAMNYFGGNRELAEDITQKVFLKLLTKLDFRGQSEFTTWLYRVTINACIDEARKNRRFVDLTDVFGFAERRGPQVQQLMAESGEVTETVQNEIAKLKPKFRVPVVLKYSEGLSYNEIADVLGCSIGTVSSRLNRAHKTLADRLGHLRNAL
jgi:RNA polymerase sigma-70 factor (ECF subfamily)